MTQRTTIFEEGASQVIEVTIPAGETESEAFDIGSASAVGFVMPADGAYTGQNVTILVGASQDGTFYQPGWSDGSGGFVIDAPGGNKVRTLSPTQSAMIAPFRWLRLQSDAPTAPITIDGEPGDTLEVIDAPLLVGATSATFGIADLSGTLFGGDTFLIAGDATVYTVATRVAAAADAFTQFNFSPPIAVEAAAGTAVVFSQVGVRGEQLDRVFQVVTKD